MNLTHKVEGNHSFLSFLTVQDSHKKAFNKGEFPTNPSMNWLPTPEHIVELTHAGLPR